MYGLPSARGRPTGLNEATQSASCCGPIRDRLSRKAFTLTAPVCEPKPEQRPHLSLWIGGMGERNTLCITADADGWNAFPMWLRRPLEAGDADRQPTYLSHQSELKADPLLTDLAPPKSTLAQVEY